MYPGMLLSSDVTPDHHIPRRHLNKRGESNVCEEPLLQSLACPVSFIHSANISRESAMSQVMFQVSRSQTARGLRPGLALPCEPRKQPGQHRASQPRAPRLPRGASGCLPRTARALQAQARPAPRQRARPDPTPDPGGGARRRRRKWTGRCGARFRRARRSARAGAPPPPNRAQ